MNEGRARPEPDADADSMAGWAQLLHDIVERRLRPTGATDLVAPSWDAMFDDALATVMQQMLSARLDALTPEQFLTAYRGVHGDAALLTHLDQLVQAREQAADRERTVLRLAADARIAGRLRLSELIADETLDVGLFDPSQPQLAAWRFRDNSEKRPLHRILRVRVTAPAAGAVQVVADDWTGPVWADRWRTPPIDPMTPARIGTLVAGAPDLIAELTLHAPIAIALDAAGTVTRPQITGYVRTLDGRLLLDAPET